MGAALGRVGPPRFLEYALRLAGDGRDARPRYWDAFAKATYRPNADHELGVHVLQAEDRMVYDAAPREPSLASAYGSGYAWLTWRARVAERLTASTVASVGTLDWRRAARVRRSTGAEEVRVERARLLGRAGGRDVERHAPRRVWGAGRAAARTLRIRTAKREPAS